MPLTSAFALQVQADYTKAVGALATDRMPLSDLFSVALASGTSAGQADMVFADTRVLAPSSNEDIDLNGTTFKTPFGDSLALLRVKGIVVRANAANSNNVVVGAAAATPWTGLLTATGTVTLRPGAVFSAFAGVADAVTYAVGAGATDLLRVANSGAGTSVTYDIVIVGATV